MAPIDTKARWSAPMPMVLAQYSILFKNTSLAATSRRAPCPATSSSCPGLIPGWATRWPTRCSPPGLVPPWAFAGLTYAALEIAEKLEEHLAALRQFPENALRFYVGEKMGNIIVTPDCWVTFDPNPWGLLGQFQMEVNMLGDDGLRQRSADPLNLLVPATALPA